MPAGQTAPSPRYRLFEATLGIAARVAIGGAFAWVFLSDPMRAASPAFGVYFAVVAAYFLAERLAYRGRRQPGNATKRWTRPLLLAGFAACIALPPLRYQPGIPVPTASVVSGVALIITGIILRVWSIHTLGPFFTGDIQVYDDQPVIERGPFRVIRHPAYLGTLLQAVGFPLILGTYAVLTASALFILALLVRLNAEERFLTENLTGYRDYQRRTSRLIPLVW